MSTLHLRVPALAETQDPDLETRAVFVEEWVENLPYADPDTVLQAVLENLQQLNKNPVAHGLRIELLERYLAPFEFAITVVRQHTPSMSTGSVEKKRAQTDLSALVAAQLACGYKLVIAETFNAKGRGRHDLIRAVQRTVACLCQVMLHGYHAYRPMPKHIWTELAELYQYAQNHKILDYTPPNSDARSMLQYSALELYKATLTTSLIDPYQLVHGDVWRVYDFLVQRAVALRIESLEPVEKPAGVFYVDPQRDEHPAPLRRLEAVPTQGFFLNTRPLLTSLQRRINEIGQASGERLFGSAQEVEYRFVTRILDTLGSPPARQRERDTGAGHLTLTTGLATAHYFVRTDTDLRAESGDGEINLGDVLPGEQTDFSRHTYAAELWEQTNRSDAGTGIVRAMRPNHAINVGDLIGLRSDGALGSSPWSMGVLRWLSITGDGEYRAGIEFLSHNPSHVALNPHDADGATEIALRLSAPNDTAIVLVIPKGLYRPGRRLVMDVGGRTSVLTLASVRESLVHCTVVDAIPDPP
ncbi:MAG: hypothetical protein ACI8PT_000530 [Gammaproteobacteria bacterium]|jgi:hypothetical protein